MYLAATEELQTARAARAAAVHGSFTEGPIAPPTRRAQFGSIAVELRSFARQHATQLTPNARTAHLVMPISGAFVAVTDHDSQRISPGIALLLTKHERTDFTWAPESIGLILHIPIALLQQAVAGSFNEARRLAAVGHALALSGAGSELSGLLAEALAVAEGLSSFMRVDADRRLAQALVTALKFDAADELFPISRSLQRASHHLLTHPDHHCSAEELARIAGVTLPTLQRNVKTCLGMPLARFVEQVRLTWVRERLGSESESRSIAQFAEACGYHNSSTLARSYQRLFGETPTQTRARAFAATRR